MGDTRALFLMVDLFWNASITRQCGVMTVGSILFQKGTLCTRAAVLYRMCSTATAVHGHGSTPEHLAVAGKEKALLCWT